MNTARKLYEKDWFAFSDAHAEWREDIFATPWDREVMDHWDEILSAIGIESDTDSWTHNADSAENATLSMDAMWRHNEAWKPDVVGLLLEPQLRTAVLALGAVLDCVEDLYPCCCAVISADSKGIGCCAFARDADIVDDDALMEQLLMEHVQIVLNLFAEMLAGAKKEHLSEFAFIRDAERHGWLYDDRGNRIGQQRKAA